MNLLAMLLTGTLTDIGLSFSLMQSIARHVLNLHMNQANDNEENAGGEIDIDKMKRYIAYCKS